MVNIEVFNNLRQMQRAAVSGETVASPRFAKKRIAFETVADSKLAISSAELLTACVTSGLFKPDVVIGKNSIKHVSKQEMGPAFVEVTIGPVTYNIFADLFAPDPRRFIRAPQLESLTDADKITIISGVCLFSAPAASARLSSGSSVDLGEPGNLDNLKGKVIDISVDDRLQVSEMDTILRLTNVMSAINPNGRNVELALNIPRVEYYMYVLEAFEKGLIDKDIVLKWFDLVDQRYARIEGLMRKRTPQEFGAVSINPLDSVEGKIRGLVQSKEPKDLFRKISDSLKAQSLLWKYAIEKSDPQRFGDLSNLSYVVGYLMLTQDNTTFPIAIENPEEIPIARNLKILLDGLLVKMLMLYPHSNAIPDFEPKNGKVNNYFLPPAENQLGVLREVARLNRQI